MNGKKFLLLCSLFITCWTVSAQSYSKSAVRKSTLVDGTEFLLDAKKVVNEDPGQSIELLQKALEFSISAKNYRVEGEAYFVLGNINAKLKQYDLAIDYYEKETLPF